jgi:C-terminal processing protease CtpA/Prc
MLRFILGAAGAVAAGALLLAPAERAAAQVTADEHGVSVGSPHETSAETTDQQANRANQQLERTNQQEYQSQNQPQSDSAAGQRSDRQQSNPNREWNDREGSRRGDRDWRSDIRFGDRTAEGLTISRVNEGSHYYHSGLRDGDIIVSYNGRPLQSEEEFGRWANERSRERVPVIVLRDGQRETVYIQYQGQGQSRSDRDQERSYVDNAGSMQSQAYLGVRFEMRLRNGAVISAIVPDSPADHAGLEAGDEIDIEFARRAEQQTQAVLEEHPRNVASADYQEGDRNWQDRNIEQSSYDDPSTIGATNENRSSDQVRERAGERRGGGLLQRLRN